MGNVTTVVLTLPFRPNTQVEAGLSELGLSKVMFDYPEDKIWILPGLKISDTYGDVDGLKEKVLALPWGYGHRDEHHIQVLWEDDYTHEDDSMAGRTKPYSWNHEIWVIS